MDVPSRFVSFVEYLIPRERNGKQDLLGVVAFIERCMKEEILRGA